MKNTAKEFSFAVFFIFLHYSALEKESLPTPHSGHTKSSGRSSHLVPGAMPFSSFPLLSSYSHPQISQTYFILISVLSHFSFYLCKRFKILCPMFTNRTDEILRQYITLIHIAAHFADKAFFGFICCRNRRFNMIKIVSVRNRFFRT